MGDTDAVDAVRKLCALDGVDELDAVEREAVSVAFNKAAAPRSGAWRTLAAIEAADRIGSPGASTAVLERVTHTDRVC